MHKLEIYNLANASHWMDQRDGYPYIESLCNQRDPVSDRLLYFSPDHHNCIVYVMIVSQVHGCRPAVYSVGKPETL